MFSYVYRITNLEHNKHYYGVRSSKIEPSNDLGIKYFSSSTDKEFKKDQLINPNKYKYKIVKIFQTRNDAVLFEMKLHNKFNVGINSSFYNKAKQTSCGYDRTGTFHSDDSRLKMSTQAIGRQSPNKGIKFTDSWKQNLSIHHANVFKENNPMFGVKHSDISKKKMSERQKNRERLTCPHCNKTADKANMLRWHFANCKEKQYDTI